MEEHNEKIASNNPPPEQVENRFLKRISLLVISVFLIFLFVSNMLGPHILLIIGGKISSHVAINSEIEFGNATITFANNTLDAISKLYTENQNTEFKLCLVGKEENEKIVVDSIYLPRTYQRTPVSVTAEMCSQDTIIELHSHPFLHCIFSDQDVETYKKIKENNPSVIIGLMCEKDRFAFIK